jgi:PAS domain S-box-containing protein
VNSLSAKGSYLGGRLAFCAGLLALAAVYFAAAKLGLALAFQAEQVTAVWPPTGIALAAVLLFGYRVWPGIALGAFVANVTTNEPVLVACGIAAGNTLEALSGALLLQQLIGFRPSMERLRDVLGLVVLAAAGSASISATIGVISLCWGGLQPWRAFSSLWWLWWLGDAAGTVLVAPLFLAWTTGWKSRPTSRMALEGLALVAALALVGLIVFSGGARPSISRHPHEYTIFPFVVWAALRFGQRGTTAVTLIASGIALWGTVHGYGPFATGTTEEDLILLQAFMAVVAVTALLLSSAIGERTRAADAARQSDEKSRRQFMELEALYRTAPVGLSLVDSSLRFLRINETLAEINGISIDKTLGRTLREVIPEIAPLVEPIYRKVFKTAMPVLGFEVHGMTPRESVARDWLVNFYPLPGLDGSVAGVSTLVEEITERKRAERALIEADRRKTEFLATLAHELRNPLAPLANALRLLEVVGNDGVIQVQARGIMERQLGHMTRLIDDLLDVSRINRNKLRLQKERMELAAAVQSALEATQPLMGELGHKVSVTLPTDKIYLQADPVRLVQILTNLLNNAAKFTPRGGSICLTARVQGDEVTVSVRDTGIGVPPEHLPHLFDMFSQTIPALDRSPGGLGIGLSLVRSLAELHGGRVEARSAGMNRGSEFIVHLPTAAPPLQEDPTKSVQKEPCCSSQSCQVLVVDDNADSTDCLSMMLELAGHQVQTARDGPEALEKAGEFRPKVILLDIGLPRMNGYEVARRIRQEPWGKDIMLVAVTGWGQLEDKKRAFEAGFDQHLTKPVDPDAFFELLRQPSMK